MSVETLTWRTSVRWITLDTHRVIKANIMRLVLRIVV